MLWKDKMIEKEIEREREEKWVGAEKRWVSRVAVGIEVGGVFRLIAISPIPD